MPGRRTSTEHVPRTTPIGSVEVPKSIPLIGAIRARLRKVFPNASNAELDEFTQKTVYYAKEARDRRHKKDREVPLPKER
jgi:hypothetical protein